MNEEVPTVCIAWGRACKNEIVWEFNDISDVYASVYSCEQHREATLDLYLKFTLLMGVEVRKAQL